MKRLLKRREHNPWETLRPTLTWWCMRYGDPAQATRGLQTVAANLPNKLLAISMQTEPLPTLWIGLPAGQDWSVAALRPYGVWLSKESGTTVDAFVSETVTSWQQMTQWPSAMQWTGLLANGYLYMEEIGESPAGEAVSWPPSNGQHPAAWQLPDPVLGTAAQLDPVPVQPLSRPLSADVSGLYLGINGNSKVYAPERVQVWGDRASLHGWTIQIILNELAKANRLLVVIDGRGDMAAQLPLYKPFVTALKGEQLHYVHMEDELRQQGFNPLQPLAWESVEQTADRWQRWLTALGIWPSGVSLDTHMLCMNAIHSGVNNLSALPRWFHQSADIPQTAHSHIQRALRQVQQSPRYATWLRRPRPLLARPLGLVFACSVGTDAVKRTMTAALLDAALMMPDVTLVLTGVPNDLLQGIPDERLPRRVVMVNGVKSAESVEGIGRISNPIKRQQMLCHAFDNISSQTAQAAAHERLTIASAGSVFWLTDPPIQTVLPKSGE